MGKIYSVLWPSLTLACILGSPNLALAQNASAGRTVERLHVAKPVQPSPLFLKLDRNHDGYLSRSELESPAAMQGNWIAMDRDRDGLITPQEFTEVGPSVETPVASQPLPPVQPPVARQ